MASKSKLMISYSHSDRKEADSIRDQLSEKFEILIDQDYFALSSSTRPEMKRMVDDADVVLVLMSPDSVSSTAVRFEVQCALNRESDEKRKVLFAAMIRRCSPMPEWDGDRLWANLHSDYATEFRKLKRNLIVACKKAVPKATHVPNSDALYKLALTAIPTSGFVLKGEIELVRRGDELPDNPLSASMLNVDGYRYFSACVATYLDWTMLLYFPRTTPNGGFKDSLFSYERFGTRQQISARLEGYISRLHEGASHSEPEDFLIKAFRRSPKIMDVVLSPYVVRPSYFSPF